MLANKLYFCLLNTFFLFLISWIFFLFYGFSKLRVSQFLNMQIDGNKNLLNFFGRFLVGMEMFSFLNDVWKLAFKLLCICCIQCCQLFLVGCYICYQLCNLIIASIFNFENMFKQHCGSCDVSMDKLHGHKSLCQNIDLIIKTTYNYCSNVIIQSYFISSCDHFFTVVEIMT